jgi:hypothetical protein
MVAMLLAEAIWGTPPLPDTKFFLEALDKRADLLYILENSTGGFMSQSDQIRDDLSFVRDAVARRDRSPVSFTAPYYIWAVYVLIGYALLDFDVLWAEWFFATAWIPACAASAIAQRFLAAKRGECDRTMKRKSVLHFVGGGFLAVAAVVALAWCVPAFRGEIPGQVAVVLFGIIYFLAGVHFDRSFLWLGPVLVIGGIVVGFVPHYGWSALGIVIAGGLCAAAVISSRRARSLAQAEQRP